MMISTPAATGLVQSPALEVETARTFQRSYSRVFYESDCSTPTSWEFCGLQTSETNGDSFAKRLLSTSSSSPHSQCPMPNLAQLSLLRSNNNSSSESSQAELRPDGSRNSTGSSTGSHKSQDSGFSDSGETRRQMQLLQCLSQHNHSSSKNQSQLSKNINLAHISSSSATSANRNSQVLTQSQHQCDNSNHYHSDLHLSLPVPPPPFPTSQVPVSVVVNGNCLHSSRSNQINNDCVNGNCLYQEIIVARSVDGIISAYPAEQHAHQLLQQQHIESSTLIGAPTCCSTPKKPSAFCTSFTPSKMTVMEKIDNFESLNKNINVVAKALDTNNNSSSASETRSSFFSRPPSRIPTPPPITPTVKTKNTSSSSNCSGGKSISYTTVISNNNEPVQQSPRSEVSSFSLCRLSPKLHEVSNISSQVKLFNKDSSKWQSLPKGFKRIHVRDNSKKDIVVKSHFDNDAVRLWLHELRLTTETECFHSLQLKDLNVSAYYSNESIELNNSDCQQQGNTSLGPAHLVSASLLSIRYIERIASLISGEFSRICKYLEFKLYAQVPPIIFNLLENIEDFLNQLKESLGYLTKFENRLIGACSELRMSTLTFCDGVKSGLMKPSKKSSQASSSDEIANGLNNFYMNAVVEGVVQIGNQFSQVVDQRLTKDLDTILDVIETSGFGARMALESFSIILYDGGMHLCRLASNIRTVRVLLNALLESRDENEQILALRCLATVLCVGEAVKDFDKAGGFEIIADILHDSGFGLVMKCEAVAVLTQVTDPWIDLEATLCNLGSHLDKIVVSLTNLVQVCSNEEDSFLLIVAAISNLTFLELSSIELLQSYGTIPLILNAAHQRSDFYSVFILDHVSTILANMAGIEKCRQEVVKSGGVSILLHFLQKSPSPYDSLAEITACERLQQKSTIAISRLASEPGVPEMVIRMGGVQRLVQLSKEDKERNYSDGVLIACLATLRKLVTVCGNELIQQLHAEDLIYPRLLDSFLLFSSRQESCV